MFELDLGGAGEVRDFASGLRSLCQGDDQFREPGDLRVVGGSVEALGPDEVEAVREGLGVRPVDARKHGIPVATDQRPSVCPSPEPLAVAVGGSRSERPVPTFQPVEEALGADDFWGVGEVDLLEDVRATAAEPAPVTDADVAVKPAEVDLDGPAVVAGALAAEIAGGALLKMKASDGATMSGA
ncbi:hypothetical protein [Streptomyces sp. NWU49]|uniref:hypothetical protein n=1 Tax=Streptomyces sp. NWU49 TaxID=2201153 RepID=UPI0011B5ECD1|nr:hypothetical protein [Streptomyces sp. NWU49]